MVSACLLAVIVSVHAGRDKRQLFSSSRFSSSGLVFPGPPSNPGPQQRARPVQPRPAEDLLAVEKSDTVGPAPGFNGPANRQGPPQQQRGQQGPNFRNGPRPPFSASGSSGQPGQPKPNNLVSR